VGGKITDRTLNIICGPNQDDSKKIRGGGDFSYLTLSLSVVKQEAERIKRRLAVRGNGDGADRGREKWGITVGSLNDLNGPQDGALPAQSTKEGGKNHT